MEEEVCGSWTRGLTSHLVTYGRKKNNKKNRMEFGVNGQWFCHIQSFKTSFLVCCPSQSGSRSKSHRGGRSDRLLSHLHDDVLWLSFCFSGAASISSTPAWVIRSAMFFSKSSMRVLISSSTERRLRCVKRESFHDRIRQSQTISQCTGRNDEKWMKKQV